MSSSDIEDIISKLTLSEKIKLLTGLGWWHTEPIPSAGIPSMRFSDGPNGIRGTRFFNGVPSNCFPSSTGLAASFDLELAREVGEALGEEARAKGILVQPREGEVSERALREIYLKPFQIAIKESNPWALMTAYNRVNGVHVSEDSRLVDGILRKEWGFQGMVMSDWIGVYSTVESIKAGVDLEMPGPSVMRGRAVERAVIAQKLFPADIDARVRKILGLLKHARESGIPFDGPEEPLDTPATRAILRKAAAESVVLLKNEKGLLPLGEQVRKIAVIGPNAKVAVTSGGGSARLRSTYTVSPLEGIVEAAKKTGAEVTYALGTSSYRQLPVLNPYISKADGGPGMDIDFWNDEPSADFLALQPEFTGQFKGPTWTTSTLNTECIMFDGIVDCWMRFTCTFTPDESGDWEFELNLAGRGNLFVDGKLILDLSTNPPKGESFFELGTASVRAVVQGLKKDQAYRLELRLSSVEFVGRGPPIQCWGGIRLSAIHKTDPEEGIKKAAQLAKESDVAIVVVGLNHDWETEGHDRADLELPGLTNRLVSEVLKANPATVVVNQSGSAVTMPWAKEASALVQAFYGGNELGNGLADVLFGRVNPSAKLPLTFPARLEDVPSYASFGDRVQEHGKVLYNEGVFVGYRGYEIKNVQPLFSFGFGLSYSTFQYDNLEVTAPTPEGSFNISFKITNTSNIAGKEVSQIYVSDPESSLPRPRKELKGFAKTELKAGETKRVQITLDREALGFYDDRQARWVAEKGIFRVSVGQSSDKIVLEGEAKLEERIVWTGL
ncbi:hypothetical protein EST38_g1191 [Candolleomyces aberdarensis]|uniref:beta-glucosidase n=1 Tax=Candolleomyces aberdarensis TaxID=2316362 RepID=A0A4Q2E070_9AGAR|nr:hypothetical protein EST38_g1191 [Candolleomyces aberdarensis]